MSRIDSTRQSLHEGLPNRIASIFKVVAVCSRWSLFRVVVQLGGDLGQQDCQLSCPIVPRRRLAVLIFGGRRQSAVGGRWTAVGGRRTDGGAHMFGDLRRLAALMFGGRRSADLWWSHSIWQPF